MQSWVFRHRARLRVLYGPPPALPRVGPTPVPAPRPLRAGRVERGPGGVVLHPHGPR